MTKKTKKAEKPHNATRIYLPNKKIVTVVVLDGGYEIIVKDKIPKDCKCKDKKSVIETVTKTGIRTFNIGLMEETMHAIVEAFLLCKQNNIKPDPTFKKKKT